MKKPLNAISSDLGRMSAAELAAISEEVSAAESIRRSLASLEVRHAAASGETAEARGGHTAAATAPPLANRGGKSENSLGTAVRLVLEDGKVMEIPPRRGFGGDHAFIDWMNFTTDESDFFGKIQLIDDHDIMVRVSAICKELFGFGITSQLEKGMHFYHRSYVLGDKYGVVCHGGQRSTVMVSLSGEGCAAAREGWERRTVDFLEKECGSRAKLTRLDLAYDDYTGEQYSVDTADSDFDNGLFNCGGRNPNHEYRGNWKQPNGKGRTIYVGNRDNGKFCRVYEKGRQLGDKSSNWCRVEVEMKNKQRIIPFDALTRPGEYLAASYPAFAWVNVRQERVFTTKKTCEISYEKAVETGKHQLGKLINAMLEIEGAAEKVVQKLIRDGIPSRLKVPHWLFGGESLHEQKRITPDRQVFDALALGLSV